MDRDPLLLESLQALELRVLEGPQAGARAPLAAGTPFIVAAVPPGLEAEADILLRDSPAPARVRVSAERAHALVEVLEGELRLGDQVLAAGAQAVWACHAPMRIGCAAVAFGLACEDDWSAAPGAPASPSSAPAGPAEAPATRPPLRRRAEAWLAATGAGVLLACAGSLWLAHVAAAPRPVPAVTAAALDQALKAGGFSTLEAVLRPDGRLVVRGRVADLSERSRLEAWLDGRQWSPGLDLLVDEAIAREVTEVFRVNGVAGQLRSAQAGRFVVEVAERDTDRLARAEDVVRRDVRGLVELTVRNTARPLPPPTPPVPDDPNKRIASLVPGELAYVVTVDGARYFVGALLPSGHRITRIATQSVVLERDGRETHLNF